MAGDWGYLTDIEARFVFGRTLGHGGSGLVRSVRDRSSGAEFACKTIRKDLREDNQALVRREVTPSVPAQAWCLTLQQCLEGGMQGLPVVQPCKKLSGSLFLQPSTCPVASCIADLA